MSIRVNALNGLDDRFLLNIDQSSLQTIRSVLGQCSALPRPLVNMFVNAQDASMALGAAIAALALLPTASAHGYVSSIVAGGKTYLGSNPNWYYQPAGQVVPTAGWFALNQDNGMLL